MRRGIGSIPIYLAVTLMFAGAPASAQRWSESSVTPTGRSGYDDRFDARILILGNREALYGLKWAESGDKPCHLILLSRNLQNGNETRPASYQFDICGGTAQPVRYVPPPNPSAGPSPPLPGFAIGSESRTVEFTRPRFFVRGIRVCANAGNHRLKGIELHAGRVRKESWQVDPPNADESAQMFGCGGNEWRNRRFCPDGKVAVGVVVHYDTLFMTGLELLCGRVQP